MGWFSPDPKTEISSLLERVRVDLSSKETLISEALRGILRDHLEIFPKTEAGVQGCGTKVDIAFEHKGWDNIVSVKKDITPQKAKTLLGENVLLLAHWKPNRRGLRIWNVVVVSEPAKTEDSFAEFVRGLAYLDAVPKPGHPQADIEAIMLAGLEASEATEETRALLKVHTALVIENA